MKRIIPIFFFLFGCGFYQSALAQDSFEPKANGQALLTVGVGASAWGIPFFGRIEVPVSENVTVGGGASFQSNRERLLGNAWTHTIIGFNGRGSYHFNTLIGLPPEWDLYAGASISYFIWNTRYNGDISRNYTGLGTGGVSVGAHVGGRYFFKENIAVNLEFGGGNVLSAGTIGATFFL